MATIKPGDPFYDMIDSALSAGSPSYNSGHGYNTLANLGHGSAPIHGVDYYMAIAQKNCLQVQQTIDHHVIQSIDEDTMKKRIKTDIAGQFVQSMLEDKITFTSQDNRLEMTKIIRAKTYVFTHDELVKFIEKIIK